VKAGDLIEAVNGKPTRTMSGIVAALYSLSPQQAVVLGVVRRGHVWTPRSAHSSGLKPRCSLSGPDPARAAPPSIGQVSDPLAPGGGDFLRNMLGDLLRLIRTEGPLQWELAFQLATSVAAGDEPDPNPTRSPAFVSRS